MAIRIDIEDERGQVYGYWFIEQYIQNIRAQRLTATVLGYKNKATRGAGKQGWQRDVVIEGAAWAENMTMRAIEDAVMASPVFAGSVTTA